MLRHRHKVLNTELRAGGVVATVIEAIAKEEWVAGHTIVWRPTGLYCLHSGDLFKCQGPWTAKRAEHSVACGSTGDALV